MPTSIDQMTLPQQLTLMVNIATAIKAKARQELAGDEAGAMIDEAMDQVAALAGEGLQAVEAQQTQPGQNMAPEPPPAGGPPAAAPAAPPQ